METLNRPATPAAPAAPECPVPQFYRAGQYDTHDSVGFLMHQVVQSMRRRIEQAMSEHELTAAQWAPVWLLKRDGPRTMQELARELDADTGATTRLVDRLVAKGLIRRTRLPSDRRVVRLSLTPAGETLAANVPEVLARLNNELLRGFDEDEWKTLKALLRRVLANGQALAGSARSCS